VKSGQFFDPPMTYGYLFETDGSSLFTKVGLPIGLGNNFTVTSSEGTETVGANGEVQFFGVESFTITGIDPLVDQDDPEAFPVYLEFSEETGNNFTMTPLLVPEPGALALLGIALCSALTCGRRRR
jgi:hypothetical protein